MEAYGIRSALETVVGAERIRTGSGMETYLVDARRQVQGAASAVVFPSSATEVQRIVSLCRDHDIAIVPQGGNTGLVGGGIARSASHVVVNLSRMNRIREIDPDGNAIVAEAGAVLARVQEAALDADRLFPLSLGSEGSCQVGGVISTNAGGIAVLRYGMMRDLTLGLEVVLPDGTLWSGLNTLRKNNTGYDLKQLFIGGEGTLGIVTAAALRLFPLPVRRETALVAVDSVGSAIALFNLTQKLCGGITSAFEYMSGDAMALTLGNLKRLRNPFTALYPHYVLIELDIPSAFPDGAKPLEDTLHQAFEQGLLLDGALAESEAARKHFWGLREGMVEAAWMEGGVVGNDISVPIARTDAFLRRAAADVAAIEPGARLAVYGHLGDGNLHFTVIRPRETQAEAFLALAERIVVAIADAAMALGGSFSAEHGIGRHKVLLSQRFGEGSPEARLRLAVKKALDPDGIMNRGAMFPAQA